MNTYTRFQSFVAILGVYLVAFASALLTARFFAADNALILYLTADVAATVVVWLFTLVFKNASVYDPYWSVAPIALLSCWILSYVPALNLLSLLCLIAVLFWGIRLTVNWAQRFQGLAHQDWRYSMYKARFPRLWFLVDLFGICLMPTLLVFLGMAPLLIALGLPGTPTWVSCLGLLICIGATVLETIADHQMHAFRRQGADQTIRNGLWSRMRHPNYLGEILFWWGVYLLGAGAMGRFEWSLLLGPVCITALFVFVSIPMMEKHLLKTRASYRFYRESVPMLLPLQCKKMRHMEQGEDSDAV